MPSTTCGWCGRFSNMKRATGYTRLPYGMAKAASLVAAYACDYCHRLSIMEYQTAIEERYRDEEIDDVIDVVDRDLSWIPRYGDRRTYDDVPQPIADAASEAHLCRSVDAYRSAVQMARSVVEATAKAKGITSGRLAAKIDAMFDRGLVREHVRDAAHEVRHLGNEMAHGDFIEGVTAEEADEVLELMAEVLHEVFQSPARVERRKAARLAGQQGRPPE